MRQQVQSKSSHVVSAPVLLNSPFPLLSHLCVTRISSKRRTSHQAYPHNNSRTSAQASNHPNAVLSLTGLATRGWPPSSARGTLEPPQPARPRRKLPGASLLTLPPPQRCAEAAERETLLAGGPVAESHGLWIVFWSGRNGESSNQSKKNMDNTVYKHISGKYEYKTSVRGTTDDTCILMTFRNDLPYLVFRVLSESSSL